MNQPSPNPMSLSVPFCTVNSSVLRVQFSLGSVHCEVVSSMFKRYLSSEKLHITSIVCIGEICELLCYYFWNSLGIASPYQYPKKITVRAKKPHLVTHLIWNAVSLMTNKAGAWRRQRYTEHSPLFDHHNEGYLMGTDPQLELKHPELDETYTWPLHRWWV